MKRTIVSLLLLLGTIAGCGKAGRLSGYHGPVNCLAVVDGDVWAGTPSGLIRFTAKGKAEIFLWTGTPSGTFRAPASSRIPAETRKLADSFAGINQVRGISAWKNGVALATSGGVVEFSTKDGKFGKVWTSRNGLGHDSVRSVYTRGKRLWAATIFGASVLDASSGRWKNYDTASGLTSRHTMCMAEYSGKLWVSCINGGLAWLDESAGKWRPIPQTNGLGNKYIYSMDSDEAGLWLGTAGGVNLYTAKGAWDEKVCSDGFTEYSVYAIRKTGDTLWFGTAFGLFSRNTGKDAKASTRQVGGLPSNDITGIVADGKSLLVGTKAGVVRIRL
jgi:ligand-binding sensor domain-containing protein